jgi:cell division protein FtsQ
VDLADPDDVKVVANNSGGEVLVHLGSSSYLDRYKVYVAHLQEWRQQFDKVESVDLRYDRQIIVNPDLRGAAKQPPLSASAAKAAMAAGVKPAALTAPLRVVPGTPRASSLKLAAKPSVRKRVAKVRWRKLAPKNVKAAAIYRSPPKNSATPKAGPRSAAPSNNSTVPAKAPADAAKPGKKPSPAISKGQEPT